MSSSSCLSKIHRIFVQPSDPEDAMSGRLGVTFPRPRLGRGPPRLPLQQVRQRVTAEHCHERDQRFFHDAR